jgi:hypothetical protein
MNYIDRLKRVGIPLGAIVALSAARCRRKTD